MINCHNNFPYYLSTKKPNLIAGYDFTTLTTSILQNNKRSFTSDVTAKMESDTFSPWKRRRTDSIHEFSFSNADDTTSSATFFREKSFAKSDQEIEEKQKPLSKTLIWNDQALQKSHCNECFICNYKPNENMDTNTSCTKLHQSTLTNYFSIQTTKKQQPLQKNTQTLDKCTFCNKFSCNECNATCSKCNEIFCNFCCRKKYGDDVYVICLECDAQSCDDAMCLD